MSRSKTSPKNSLESKVTKLIKFFKKKPLYFVALVAVVGAGIGGLVGVSAARGDCGDNSIIRCGAFNDTSGPSQANLNANVARYHTSGSVDKIFGHYGIPRNSLGSLPLGEVRIDGTIWLNGRKVATNAKSTGRQFISKPGVGTSTRVNAGGVTVYERAPAVSFRQNSLQAWVKLDASGKFMYAVITSCGNPTVATPTPPPPPPPPAPTGSVKCVKLTAEKLSRTKYKFTTSGSKTGSATISKVMVNFGDGTNQSKATTNGTATFEHEYKPGQYKAGSTVYGALAGKPLSNRTDACYASIKIEKPPEEPKTPNYVIKKYVNESDAQDNGSAVSVRGNEEFTYRIDVENKGETKLTNVKVWDVLPAGVEYVDNSLDLNGTKVSNDSDFFNASKGVVVPAIELNSKAVFTMKAVIKVAEPGATVDPKCDSNTGKFYNNVAKADPEGTGTNLGEKTDPAVVVCKDIPKQEKPAVDIEKEVTSSEVEVGEEFGWKLIVTNNGKVDLKNVKVSDSAPANVEFISSPNVEGSVINVNATTFAATIAELKVGQVVRFEIRSKVTVFVPGDIVNTACVDAEEVTEQGTDPKKDDCDDAKTKTKEKVCTAQDGKTYPIGDTRCGTPCPVVGLEDLSSEAPECEEAPVDIPSETPSTGGGELVLMASTALLLGGGVYYYTFTRGKRV